MDNPESQEGPPEYSEIGDAELVDRSLAGDEYAWSQLEERWDPYVMKIVWEKSDFDEHERRDVADESWTKAFANRHRFDPARSRSDDPFKTWLSRITSNTVTDRWRKYQRRYAPASPHSFDTVDEERDLEANVVDRLADEWALEEIRKQLGEFDVRKPERAAAVRLLLRLPPPGNPLESNQAPALNFEAAAEVLTRYRRLLDPEEEIKPSRVKQWWYRWTQTLRSKILGDAYE